MELRRRDDAALPLVVYRRDGARAVHSTELHGHRFFVIFLADSGAGKLRFSGRSVCVSPGHVHLLAPGELHDTSGLGSVTGWAAEFTEEALVGLGEGITPFLPRSGQTHLVGFARRASGVPAFATVPEADREAWGRRFEILDQELREARLGYREAARAQLQIILINAARLIAPLASGDAIPPLVNEVFAVIERRFAEPISLDDHRIHRARLNLGWTRVFCPRYPSPRRRFEDEHAGEVRQWVCLPREDRWLVALSMMDAGDRSLTFRWGEMTPEAVESSAKTMVDLPRRVGALEECR